MFSVTVRRSIMLAHSLKGEIFGPAQGVHGATFVVEARFFRAGLTQDGIVCDIGAASRALETALAPLNYAFLDEKAEFQGQNTTTEWIAKHVWDSLAAEIHGGGLGAGLTRLQVTLRETPDAWADYDAPL